MYTWPSPFLDIASLDYRDGKVTVGLQTHYSDHKYFHMSKDLLDRAFKKMVEHFELVGIKLVEHISAVRSEKDGRIILWEFAPKFEQYPDPMFAWAQYPLYSDILRYITEAYVKHCAKSVLPPMWKEDIQNAEINEEAARQAFMECLKKGKILLVKDNYPDIENPLNVTSTAAKRLSEYYCSHEEFWDAVIDYFKGYYIETAYYYPDEQDATIRTPERSLKVFRPVAEKIAQSHGLELEIS